MNLLHIVPKERKRTVLLLLLAVVLIAVVLIFYFNIFTKKDHLESDFSKLSWTEAFDKLHTRISKEYAFTQWKGVDWDSLYSEYSPVIAQAQNEEDFDAYYIGLRSYLHEIPDRHVGASNLFEIDNKYIGGGFGVTVAKVGDGRIIFTWVGEGSPAWEAGIRAGAELISWDKRPAADALEDVATVFTSISATKEDLDLQKQHYLVRAPIGKQVSVAFLNEGEHVPQEVSLTAYDDQQESIKRGYPDAVVSDRLKDAILEIENPAPMPEAMVEKKTLANNIFYIRIWGEFDADLQQTGQTQSTLKLLQQAVNEAIAADTKGIILDLRNNLGGLDQMAADILGSFYTKKTLYEYQNAYNPSTERREIIMADAEAGSEALYINPAQHYYSGRVIALVNTRCVSSGEGIAMGIKNLPKGDVLGFYGTNGSFGLSGSEAAMPGDITVRWPSGQSLDMNKEIQLDSRNGVGGVSPSIRIPMTAENAMRVANGEDVELEEAVRILSSK
ncbi:MAG: S41 family peptidase [Eubacteriales bacterium]|nr:S41 family peptidase [Eubacteriales bacterium]